LEKISMKNRVKVPVQWPRAMGFLAVRPTVVSVIGWALSCCFLLWSGTGALAQMTDVLTWHNDSARTGQTLNEQILAPGNVNSNQFGKMWLLPTDEQSFAEPLYVAGVSIPGRGEHNVVFVETENDSAYAFDADSTNLFWHVQLLGPGEETFQTTACSITPQIGVTATPVIDRQLGPNGTIFIQAASQDSMDNCHQRLYALDLATGQETVPPVEITATYPGTAEGSFNGTVIFDPLYFVDRACLLLVNGVVYTAWSAHCNGRPNSSWVIGFDEHTLAQTNVIDLEPNGYFGSIWNSGGGPAADTNGNIYVVLGDGAFEDWEGPLDANGFPVNQDYGNSLVKLSTSNNDLTVLDFFTMYNVIYEDDVDLDFGSGCALVLPDMTNAQGSTRQLVVAAGKDQNVYLANRSNLGKYNPANNNALYQELTNVLADSQNDGPSDGGTTGGVWSGAAYYNGAVYYGPVNNAVKAFPFKNALLGASSSQAPSTFGYPGATPCVSANGVSNGIVWAVEIISNVFPARASAAVLHAYAATNLAHELYNTKQAANNRDSVGTGQKFTPPMIASARVYVATSNGVAVYGLLDQSVLTPIEQWRNTNFGNPSNVGAGANSASPAGDGVPNLIKYFLGLNPFTPVLSNQLFAVAPAIASVPYSSGLSNFVIAAQRNTLTFAKVSGPAWLNVAANGALSGAAPPSSIGTNLFVVSLTDSNGVTAPANLVISVVPDLPPSFILNPFAEPWAYVDEAYSATIATNATDPDLAIGDTLTFYMVTGPDWLTVADNGALSGTPSSLNLGVNNFLVLVVDAGELSAIGTMSITVNPASPPVFLTDPFAEPPVAAGNAYAATIATNASDPNFGAVLTFSKFSGPPWLSVEANGGLSGTPVSTNAGNNLFLVEVADATGLSSYAAMSIDVTPAAPIVAQISPQVANLMLSWTGGIPPYQVMMTTNLNPFVWQNIGGPVNTNKMAVVPDKAAAFYQIQGQ
jgi:hypothetical protein